MKETTMLQSQMTQTLAKRCVDLSAGCYVDSAAMDKHAVDLTQLRYLAKAYRAGWLTNVMSRITPLTMRKQKDYVLMADLFVETQEQAQALLNKFIDDMELFCSIAGIELTEHMNMNNASIEIQAHVTLYMNIASCFQEKFGLELVDPVQQMTQQPILMSERNLFVQKFVAREFQ